MDRQLFLGSGLGLIAATATSCVGTTPTAYNAPDVPADEHARTVKAMAPPKRSRPLIAVLADNMGSETTDFIIPWSVLTRSGVADVVTVSTEPGVVQMMPALKIKAQQTTAEFDAAHPDGPDYVIVPAYHDWKAPKAVAWMQQAAKGGATIVGICAGALTVGQAGLLEGRAGTTHWYSVGDLKKVSPSMTWRPDRRFVADRGVVTTTGVSASLPASMALVEAIAGRARAEALAAELEVASFDERHDSSAFSADGEFYSLAAVNTVAFVNHETLGIRVADGIDEICLAFAADAWSRTYKSKCLTVASMPTVRTLSGLEIVVDRSDDKRLELVDLSPAKPGRSLDATLAMVKARYGRSTARHVAMQLEHPWSAA